MAKTSYLGEASENATLLWTKCQISLSLNSVKHIVDDPSKQLTKHMTMV